MSSVIAMALVTDAIRSATVGQLVTIVHQKWLGFGIEQINIKYQKLILSVKFITFVT